MAKEGSEIIPIGDMGAVAEQGDRDDELLVINNVTVADVPYFDTYKSCLQCKARVEPHTECLGKCSNMDRMMMQRFDLSPQHIMTKLLLLYDEDGQQRTVFAFAYGETVHQIAGGNDVSVEGLTESGVFKSMILLKDKDIVKEVNKRETEVQNIFLPPYMTIEYYSHYKLPIYSFYYISVHCTFLFFDAKEWPQSQTDLFTCTMVLHCGHIFLRRIDLLNSIACTTVLHCEPRARDTHHNLCLVAIF